MSAVISSGLDTFALAGTELAGPLPAPRDRGQLFTDAAGPDGKETVILAQSAPDVPWWQQRKPSTEKRITGPYGTVIIDPDMKNADPLKILTPEGKVVTKMVPHFRVEGPDGQPLPSSHPMAQAMCRERERLAVGAMNAERPEGRKVEVVRSVCTTK